MILVTGATGNVGAQVVRELRSQGVAARAFVRDPDKAAALFGNTVEIAVGDFADAQSVRRALEGVEAVFLSSGDGPEKVGYEVGVIDAAVAAGVKRIVKASSVGAQAGSELAFADSHGRIEDHLRASGVPATILRSSFYMTNLLMSADQIRSMGKIFAPAEGAKIAAIDPRDTGSVAAVCLTSEGHRGRTYLLTGPEVMTYQNMAEVFSTVLGRRVDFVAVPDEAARQALAQAGLPDVIADPLMILFQKLRNGFNSETTDTVGEITGKEPRSFERFVREYADAFGA